jgi:hypothetical protein
MVFSFLVRMRQLKLEKLLWVCRALELPCAEDFGGAAYRPFCNATKVAMIIDLSNATGIGEDFAWAIQSMQNQFFEVPS